MLLDNEEWNNEDDNYYDIGADAGANAMDPRVVNLRYGPTMWEGNMIVDDVQVESEWMTLQSHLPSQKASG